MMVPTIVTLMKAFQSLTFYPITSRRKERRLWQLLSINQFVHSHNGIDGLHLVSPLIQLCRFLVSGQKMEFLEKQTQGETN